MKRNLFFKNVLTGILAISILTPIGGTETSAELLSKPDVPVTNVSPTTEANNSVRPAFVNPYRNVKKNVTTSTSWSSYKRVSDNVVTTNNTGSISSDRSVTFKTDVTGTISGLGISTGTAITSSVGYRLNVPKNSRVYLGYRVM